MRVLAVNAGSSSLKLRFLDEKDRVLEGEDQPADGPQAVHAALADFIARCDRIDAVGHRVVHGGAELRTATAIGGDLVARLTELVPLAPRHQPAALAGIEATATLLPDIPGVACFDTAFHAGMPPAATTYPLPLEWRDAYGLRRFGFHGLSHAYATGRTAEIADLAPGRLVSCHFGAGSSVTAVVGGRSVDTTMGFTPNEGVPMATRSGSVDVGLLTWLLEQGLTPEELREGLEARSGLLGLAGTPDMGAIVAAGAEGDARASLALDVWLHRVVQAIASMAASAGGVEAVTFTGGIGEHSPILRERIGRDLGWLGVDIDPGRNAVGSDDRLISSDRSAVGVYVVAAREDLQMAREVRSVLA